MIDIINTSYDEQLKEGIVHLRNYPEMLPFIGSKWENSKRILLLGESHFLPFDELDTNFDYYNNWYKGNSKNWDECLKGYIKTRGNISGIENSGKLNGTLALYFNLRNALLENEYLKNEIVIFDKFSFYNYFQKPAAVKEVNYENRSINAQEIDCKIAYDTLSKVAEIIKPNLIIFASVKAYDTYLRQHLTSKSEILNEIKIDFVPHAGRQWWNRESWRYAKNGKRRTGKQKFIDLIEEYYN